MSIASIENVYISVVIFKRSGLWIGLCHVACKSKDINVSWVGIMLR